MSNKLSDLPLPDRSEGEELEKSHELAAVITMMKPYFHMIDLEFAKSAAVGMHERANWLDSAAALNPMYNPLKCDIMRKQANALSKLVEVIDDLKEVDQMKAQLAQEESTQQDIMNLFK